ncbi:MAG: CoA transferase [Actinomycetota bacterium]
MKPKPPLQPGPLNGIRVIDFSSVLMGPVSTRTLGDLGADVIAIEPAIGDRNRAMGPGPTEEFSGTSLNLMRNKRSVALDLKAPGGTQVFLDIAATCDVMITNQRPGPLSRLGLDYDNVRTVRPDVVFCQAHGFPSDSPLRDEPAYDDIIQSACGLADLFERMGEPPRLLPTLVADKVCGMAIANAVMAALLHRAKTSEGQHIEIAMIDVMRAFVLTEHGSGAISEAIDAPAGYPRILTPQRRPHPTADGWINVLPYDEQHYVDLFAFVDREDAFDRELARTRRLRTMNSDQLYRSVASILPERTTADWLTYCREKGIPAAPMASLDELVHDLPIAEHPTAGAYRVIPPAERFSATPQSVRRPAPRIGEHGREVLSEIGYHARAIDDLVGDQVLLRSQSTEPAE